MEALSDVSEAFGIEGSLEDTSNDLLKLFHVIGWSNLGLLNLVGWLELSMAFLLSKGLIEGFDAQLELFLDRGGMGNGFFKRVNLVGRDGSEEGRDHKFALHVFY